MGAAYFASSYEDPISPNVTQADLFGQPPSNVTQADLFAQSREFSAEEQNAIEDRAAEFRRQGMKPMQAEQKATDEVSNERSRSQSIGEAYKKAGITIRNQELAGQRHSVTNVLFDKGGFPVFEGDAVLKSVEITQTGNRRVDAALANKAAGYEKTPKGWAWHHHQNGHTMQLVDEKVHEQTAHTGGVAGVKSNVVGHK